MTIDQLRKIHQIRPFQAFDIHLADGRSIPVSHPELLMFAATDGTFVAGMPGGNMEIVDASLVASVKPRPPASAWRGKQRGQSPE
jgi:hypothetical protein